MYLVFYLFIHPVNIHIANIHYSYGFITILFFFFSTAFSSLDPVDASIILSQSYILPVIGITNMVPTMTERGITNKNILFGLSNGYIFSLPKMLLDPRRQFKQTKMLQEEGVPPYMPELPVFPQAFINYNQTGESF